MPGGSHPEALIFPRCELHVNMQKSADNKVGWPGFNFLLQPHDKWADGPSLHCTIPTEGAPSLRFLQESALRLPKGWAAMLPAQLLSVLHRPLCMPSSYPPLRLRSGQALCKVREGRGTSSCGGFCSLKAGPPASLTLDELAFPARTPGHIIHPWTRTQHS